MNQTKKKQRPSKYLIIMSVMLSVLCIGLMVFDVMSCRETNVINRCREKEQYLEAMAYSGNYDVESIISYIEQTYATSASDYCFVAVDGNLVFVRDANYTKSLEETAFKQHFDITGRTGKIEGCRNGYEIVQDGAMWQLICYDIELPEQLLTIGICVRNDFVISEGDFDILLQHSVLYMVLFAIAFIVSVVFLSNREKENQRMEEKLTDQLVENRRLIERLGERLEAQSGMDFQRENGFCSREVIAEIMAELTEEQKAKSSKIVIRMKEPDPQTIARYSVLLERMKANKCVCCLWEAHEFVVLLLNIDKNGANNFIKQFLLQYQKMYQSDARDIQISIDEWESLQ